MAGEMCKSLRMAQTVCVIVNVEDRARLAAIIADRNRPQKYAARARIVLLPAGPLPVLRIGVAHGDGANADIKSI